ncbi:GNAT family N-acetyltransferase [Streptomyces sp. NBC_01546]
MAERYGADFRQVRWQGCAAASQGAGDRSRQPDQHRYHFWCVGVDYAAAPGFSPFCTVFADVMRDAIASGRSHLELGIES